MLAVITVNKGVNTAEVRELLFEIRSLQEEMPRNIKCLTNRPYVMLYFVMVQILAGYFLTDNINMHKAK